MLAVLGLLSNTGMASVLRVDALLAGEEGSGGFTSSQWRRFLEIPLAFPERNDRLGANDDSGAGMESPSSQSPSSVSPCCLSECVELRLVCLTTYHICETRASLAVPFLDGIFRPPPTA